MADDEQALERRSGRELDLGWCRITRTGLLLKHAPSMEEWQGLGEMLATLEGGIAWLVGDWLNTGDQEFGEMASQAISHEQWSEETVRVYRWVCSKVPPENRTMSFAHCQNVAGLAADQQREWLGKAKQGDGDGATWSAARLKHEVSVAAKPDTRSMEFLVTIAFDSQPPREQLAQEYERVGRPVFRTERQKKTKKPETL